MRAENATALSSYTMTEESIAAYIQHEQSRGASEVAIRKYKRFTRSLYEWLPEDKTITRDQLIAWRQSLKNHGYSAQTEQNYAKGVNRYLEYIGCLDIRFTRGRPRDITGQEFGYLTAIEPTGEKHRTNYVWRCRCRCGKEVEYPATRLLLGNTVSCGCLRGEHLKSVNKYFDGTSLRQSIEDQVHSTRTQSGYTGVTAKRGKWQAYITYKGQRISLGCYTDLEDAVKARARGKELVQMDAMGLLDFYEELHKDDPERPDRGQIRAMQKKPRQDPPLKSEGRVIRSNNTSGCPGVSRNRDKWEVKITFQKTTYRIGYYENIEEAIAARKEAERMIHENATEFPDWALRQRQSRMPPRG